MKHIYERTLREAIDSQKVKKLIQDLGLPAPETEEDALVYSVSFASAFQLEGQELSDEDQKAIYDALLDVYNIKSLREGKRVLKEPGLFTSGETEYFDIYEDNPSNRQQGRVGKEWGHRTIKNPSKVVEKATDIMNKISDHSEIAKLVGVLILLGGSLGVSAKIAMANNKDYSTMLNCTDAICRTYENENTNYDRDNGGTRTFYFDKRGAHMIRHENKGWRAQQNAIKAYHDNDHEDTSFDKNGKWFGGKEESAYRYILNNANKNFHEQPNVKLGR